MKKIDPWKEQRQRLFAGQELCGCGLPKSTLVTRYRINVVDEIGIPTGDVLVLNEDAYHNQFLPQIQAQKGA